MIVTTGIPQEERSLVVGHNLTKRPPPMLTCFSLLSRARLGQGTVLLSCVHSIVCGNLLRYGLRIHSDTRIYLMFGGVGVFLFLLAALFIRRATPAEQEDGTQRRGLSAKAQMLLKLYVLYRDRCFRRGRLQLLRYVSCLSEQQQQTVNMYCTYLQN